MNKLAIRTLKKVSVKGDTALPTSFMSMARRPKQTPEVIKYKNPRI